MIQNISGFEVDIDDAGVIVKITHADRSVKVGERVVSNGRISAHRGRVGTVVRIDYPYAQGRSSDVVMVRWDGDKGVSSMKMKDLVFVGGLSPSEIQTLS